MFGNGRKQAADEMMMLKLSEKCLFINGWNELEMDTFNQKDSS